MIRVLLLPTAVLIFEAQILKVIETRWGEYPRLPDAMILNACESAYPVYRDPPTKWTPTLLWSVDPERYPEWVPPVFTGRYVHEVWCKPEDGFVWVIAPAGTELEIVAWEPGAATVRVCTRFGTGTEEGCE